MSDSKLRARFHNAIGDEAVPAELKSQTDLALRRAVDARRLRMRWIPSAIAAALAVAIIASLVAIGAYRRSQTVPSTTGPTTKASPVPPAARGPIPTGTAVVIYWRSVAPDGLYASSWTGGLYKVPTLNFESGALAVQSPDGSRLSVGGVVYDTSSGALLGHLPTDATVTWADDSRHVCLATPLPGQGSPTQISYGLPGSSLTDLGKFGSWAVQVPGALVLACSASSNRVVISNVGGENDTSDVWVVNSTTGLVVYHRSYLTTSKTNANGVFVVASPHGDYLAETDSSTGSATIRQIPANEVVAQLTHMQVHGFSWTGDRVLVAPRQPDVSIVNTANTDPEVMDWRTGAKVWRAPAGAIMGGRMSAQPGGDGFAIDLFTVFTGGRPAIWLIGSDGHGRAVDDNIETLVTELIGLV
jgi:hypothetical protein